MLTQPRRVFAILQEDALAGCAHNGEYCRNLIYFIFTWKKWILGVEFEKNAANAPNIHFLRIVAVSEQTFGRTIPTRGDILGVWW